MRAVLAAACLALLVACAPPKELHDRAVVNLDGAELTRGDLDDFLAINLAGTDEAEETTGDEGDLVRSRLLDQWIDERLVLAEAEARQLSISNQQLDGWIDDPAYDTGERDRLSQREFLRERLLIELVQGQVLADVALPSGEEAIAWLEGQPRASDAGRRVVLRSLRFDEAEDADRVHRSLRRNRLTFNEAVVQNTDDESQGAPTTVDWAGFPPEVQAVLEDLKPTWSSKPVELGGSTYLFQLVEWLDPDPEAQVEVARSELFADKRRQAWDLFVDGLRDRAEIRILHKNLPFQYVSDRTG